MTPGMQAIEAYKSTMKTLFDEKGIQPESKVVSTQGPVKKVHYIQLGNGKPLILLHGGGSVSPHWTPYQSSRINCSFSSGLIL
jgi:hypothetical protein